MNKDKTKLPNNSVLQDWVVSTKFKEQTGLISAIRGFDGLIDEDTANRAKALTKMIRHVVLKNADDTTEFMSKEILDMNEIREIIELFKRGEIGGAYGTHWADHIIMAIRIISKNHYNEYVKYFYREILKVPKKENTDDILVSNKPNDEEYVDTDKIGYGDSISQEPCEVSIKPNTNEISIVSNKTKDNSDIPDGTTISVKPTVDVSEKTVDETLELEKEHEVSCKNITIPSISSSTDLKLDNYKQVTMCRSLYKQLMALKELSIEEDTDIRKEEIEAIFDMPHDDVVITIAPNFISAGDSPMKKRTPTANDLDLYNAINERTKEKLSVATISRFLYEFRHRFKCMHKDNLIDDILYQKWEYLYELMDKQIDIIHISRQTVEV